MDQENVAEVQEETTLTKIRLKLNEQKVKLWEPPYFDKEKKKPEEKNIHELATILKGDLSMPLAHIFQGLLMLQQHALEKLAARNKFQESGDLNLRLRCAKGMKTRNKTIEVNASILGSDLVNKLGEQVDRNPAMLRLICNGRVVKEDLSLQDQGIKTSSTIMVVLISSRESVEVVNEQRRLLEQTKEDAGRLGSRDAKSDEYYLQIADQSGRALDIPPEEKKALIIAMSLHEKGKAALAKADYSLALVLMLEAESEFSACRSELVETVDNFAILNLDIAWCYLMLQSVSELPNASDRLDVCERKFKESYGLKLERLQAIKGATGQEGALLMRLHLLQGIVAFHLGREREASLLLKKAGIEAELLDVNDQLLSQLVSIGYTPKEARLGLRASQGNIEGAVLHITMKRDERKEIRRKEKEERELERLRKKLGQCADGTWINVGYFKTLVGMGFTEKIASAALRQANNSLNLAVQFLQEDPDLIQVAVQESEAMDDEDVSEEDLVKLISLGYSPEMAKIALKNEDSVEEAAESLLTNNGKLTLLEETGRKRKRKGKKDKDSEDEEEREDGEAYARIKDGIAQGEEDHLDMDLKLEKEFLAKYTEMVNQNQN